MTTGFDETQATLYGFVPDDSTIYVVEKKVTDAGEVDGYTYECLTYKSEDDGARLTYTDRGQVFRVFIPTHMIRRIFQVV